jgi:hypothetical protein
MRAVTSTRLSQTDAASEEDDSLRRPSRRRRWGFSLAAATMFAAVLPVVAASPAYAVTANYSCDSGSYKTGLGRLGAFTCSGSGSTNLYVSVNVLDVSGGGPQDGPAELYCTDFAPVGVPGHWGGDCVIYSYS